MFKGLLRVAYATVKLPADVAVDFCTLGGTLTNSDSKIVNRINEIDKEIKDTLKDDD